MSGRPAGRIGPVINPVIGSAAREVVALASICKSFGGVRSLDDVSLAFHSGEAVALAGENGSGKSTLIKILSGAHAANSGEIIIDGQRRAALRPIEALRAGIHVIYQDFSLFPNLSAAENIAFGHQLIGRRRWWRRTEMRQRAAAALERMAVSLDLDALVGDLPVAAKQLIAIARALVDNARLVVMDEPTTALTEAEVGKLLAIITRLKAAGVSIVFVSHKLQELFSVCDRVVVLRNGRKVAEGPVAAFTPASLTRHMTDRDVPERRHALAEDALGPPVLRVERLSRPGRFAEVSFGLRQGEVLGIAGLLGSGRTELAKTLFGMGGRYRGSIEVAGQAVRMSSPQEAVRHGIGYLPEDRLTEGLFFDQTVTRNVEAGLFDRFRGRFGLLRTGALRRSVAGWLDRLRVKGQPSAAIQSLSGGNQQRVVLARWLAQEPKILILNGPSVGVDVGSKADIHRIIADGAAAGLATLLISDDLSELVACCNRVLVMKRGAVTEQVAGAALSEAALAASLASQAVG